MENNEEFNRRKEKVLNLLKSGPSKLFYLILALIIFIGLYIRTSNLSGLRDITTGSWTLGPDLDPFLFLRWAEYIVSHGSLYAIDTMRYVPLGFNTTAEVLLHPYLIAWFHKLAVFFGSGSIEQSAALFPVFMFGLTIISFFLFTRRIFIEKLGYKKSTMIALISSFFISVIPVLIPRTIAGIPEKESSAFFFLFLALYLFLVAWQSKNLKKQIIVSLLAGMSTSAMALVWGGYIYLFLTIGLSAFISFILGRIDRNKIYVYSIWIISSSLIMNLFSSRYTLFSLLSSTSTAIAFLSFALMWLHPIISKFTKKYDIKYLNKLPSEISSLLILVILAIIFTTAIFGLDFITSKFYSLYINLVTPVQDRLGVTVAENRQPYFTEWGASFGPSIPVLNSPLFPLFFWLFFIGSAYLIFNTFSEFSKKERITLTTSYIIFLLAIIFSRYSPDKSLNGLNFFSTSVYFIGFLILIYSFGSVYYRNYKSEDKSKFNSIDFGVLLLLSFFFFSVVSARGAVRLIMILALPASIMASYLIVETTSKALSSNKKSNTIAITISFLIVISAIYSGYVFYNEGYNSAKVQAPYVYTFQWQKAMDWVRNNTPEDAVFGHWWDYGYWVQSIGKRATVLDGGNAIAYWNHLMGRHALTGTDNLKALEFLYAHNTTHFLIDSTDIGKYGAFSSIGSDANYDRSSQITSMLRDKSQSKETKNGFVYVYSGGILLDQDIVYDLNGTSIFLPAGKAGIIGVLLEIDSDNKIISAPIGLFVYPDKYQNNQIQIPLRYAYDGEFTDFGTGVESGVFVYATITQGESGAGYDKIGSILYLSQRTVKSQLARLYLYNEDNKYFKLVHTEDDFIIADLKKSNNLDDEFIYIDSAGGFRGPIKIWEINYPSDIQFNSDYLKTEYPKDILIVR